MSPEMVSEALGGMCALVSVFCLFGCAFSSRSVGILVDMKQSFYLLFYRL